MHLGLGLGLTRLRRAAGGAPALTPLILDTDFGDRDDATVLAYLNYALDNGYAINLLGIGCDERSQYNAGGVSSCMAHFGRNASRIGKNKTGLSPTGGFDAGSSYGGMGAFPRRVLRVGDAEEVVAMYRQILTAAADNSVVFVSIGWLNNVADLLASAGDGISPLTGEQLVAAKVNRWHCMGGAYPSGGEANFQNAPADANYAVANWPATVPVYFIGNAISNGVFPTAAIAAMPLDSPIRQRAAGAGFNGLWDTCALMSAIETSEAVRPAAGSWYSWTRGTNAVNASTGVSTFTNGASGPHYYATLLQSDANLLAYLTPFCTHYRATPYTGVPLDTFAFAEGGGATTTSANGVVATLSGTASLSAVPGKLRCLRTGNGYALAATNDLFRFFPRMSRTFYVEFTTGVLTGGGEEVIFGGDRDAGGWWRFGKTTAGAWLVTFNGGADITGGTVASNTLYKAAIVFDGVAGACKLFINGSQIGSTYTTTAESIAATLGSWGFGRGAGASDSAHIATADIDTFSVYAGAASDAQAQALTA